MKVRVQIHRRTWLSTALALAALPALGFMARRALAQATAPEQVIQVVAKRFAYTPGEIRVKAGVPVRLEFTALDFMHGFHLPDLKLRADLIPGRVTPVRFTLDKPGTYEFLCDNFCGDEHELMGGKIIAEAA